MRVRCVSCHRTYSDTRDHHKCPHEPLQPRLIEEEKDLGAGDSGPKPENEPVEGPAPDPLLKGVLVGMRNTEECRITLELWLDSYIAAMKASGYAPPPEAVHKVIDQVLSVVRGQETALVLVALGGMVRVLLARFKEQAKVLEVPIGKGSDLIQ